MSQHKHDIITEGTKCRRPLRLRHGRYKLRNQANFGLSRFQEGYVIRVVCAADGRLVGDEFIQCDSNGRWSMRSFCRGKKSDLLIFFFLSVCPK